VARHAARPAAQPAARHAARASHPRRRQPGRIRAVLTLGAALGVAAIGTGAYWTDQAKLAPGPISAGTLDLTLDGDLAGPGGTHAETALSLDDMLPGESVAADVRVQNDGTVDLQYMAVATAGGGLASGLTFQVFPGGHARNGGSAADGDRSGACSGARSFGPALLTDTPETVISPPRRLGVGQSETVCIVAELPSAADNALQGASAVATVSFDATQVGAR